MIFSTNSSFRRVRTCLLVFHHPRDSQVVDLPVEVNEYVEAGRLRQQWQQSGAPRCPDHGHQNKAITANMKFGDEFDENEDLNEDNDEDNNNDGDDGDEQHIVTSPKQAICVTSPTATGCATIVSHGNIKSACRGAAESVL